MRRYWKIWDKIIQESVRRYWERWPHIGRGMGGIKEDTRRYWKIQGRYKGRNKQSRKDKKIQDDMKRRGRYKKIYEDTGADMDIPFPFIYRSPQ